MTRNETRINVDEMREKPKFAGTLEDDDDEADWKAGEFIDETTPLIDDSDVEKGRSTDEESSAKTLADSSDEKVHTPVWLERLITNYEKSVETNPIITMSMQAFILSSSGDIIAQLISVDKFDLRRLLSVGLWAFFVIGPVGLWWYEYLLSKVFGRYAVIQWVTIDQLLFAPIFIACFITGTATLEGEDMYEIWKRLKINLIPTIFANYLIWPAAQVINFIVIPRKWRMLYVNTVGFFWSIILTFFSHNTSVSGQETIRSHLVILLTNVVRILYKR